MIDPNQQFKIDETGEIITVSNIQYLDGNKRALKDPIFTFTYETEKKPFTIYSSEVNRLLAFNRWKKI